MTDWYMEQATNLREQELDDIMDQAQKYTKFRQNLPVLVRPPGERGNCIPEGLRSDSPPSTPTGSAASIDTKQARCLPSRCPDIPQGSRRRPRDEEDDIVLRNRPRLT